MLNEKGSMSILTVFTLAAVIMGSVYLFYFFTAFIEKRQAQNIADASSLAAVQVLRDKFEEEMEKKTFDTLDEFLNAEIPDEYDKLTDEPPPDFEQFKNDYIDDKIQTAELAGKLKSGTYDHDEDWLLIVKEPYFRHEYTASKNGEILYEAFLRYSAEIGDAARTAAILNHGKSEGKITFPDEGKPKLLTEAARIIKIGGIGLEQEMKAAAASGIGSSQFDIDVGSKSPRTIYW